MGKSVHFTQENPAKNVHFTRVGKPSQKCHFTQVGKASQKCDHYLGGWCPSSGWWMTILRMVGDHPFEAW